MATTDIPPPHVPAWVMPLYALMLQIGGSLWTICYILLVRESFRTRSYGMPLFALAFNFAWEVVYALFVTEALIERVVFTVWLVLNCFVVYGMLRYGRQEWAHAPVVARHLGVIWLGLTAMCAWGHYAFAKWWIDNEIGRREGKFYMGRIGADTAELGFWTAEISQIYLSVTSLSQLLIRQHSGGVSYGIWATRAVGSLLGLTLGYLLGWYYWVEGHPYVMSPFAVWLWVTGTVCDAVYPFVLYQIRKHEVVLADGRKVAPYSQIQASKKDKPT